MKKLLAILLAIVVLTTFAFAQNNSSTVDQTGNNNEATVTQTGSSNIGDVTQNATSGNGNFASIDQTGAAHEGYIDQVGDNDAEIHQAGGDGNFADIYQTGTFDRTYNSYGQTIRNYYGMVVQDGSDNEAWIVQTGGSGRVYIEQTGLDNYAIHDQGTASYGKTYNGGEIIQHGNLNEAYQWRQSTGGCNSMLIHQLNGNSNVATQDLNDDHGSDGYSHGNDLDIIQQDGDGNTANQEVYSLTSWGVGGNILSITQTGSDNTASQTANTKSNISTITQTGNMNEAVTLQK